MELDLARLDPATFQHLSNFVALRVLGPGYTTFGPGADGGRDGYFQGRAPYPSEAEQWDGVWYVQSKFRGAGTTRDSQSWLLEQVRAELAEFGLPNTKRRWPDNWILVTNVEMSAVPNSGTFDKVRLEVAQARKELASRFHIWGGAKLISLLTQFPDVRERFAHLLTPGYVIADLLSKAEGKKQEAEGILKHLVLRQFGEQQHTRLDQAGATMDARPGIHELFIDLPYRASSHGVDGMALQALCTTSARSHRSSADDPDTPDWRKWWQHPHRARIWFVRGGPGQGKSTIGQYFGQIQRAALILSSPELGASAAVKSVATEIRVAATKQGYWPGAPRIPLFIELKEFAHWLGERPARAPRGVLTYVAERIAMMCEQPIEIVTLKGMLKEKRWFVAFDGLDEVPQDVKDSVAKEVRDFLDIVAPDSETDLLALCTTRPQGYSGQLDELSAPTIDFLNLDETQALDCAIPVLKLGRSQDESTRSTRLLRNAMKTPSVVSLMTTPLQAHIMAVIVRDGGRPPDRRWQLFRTFYHVIKKREANRDLPDRRLGELLREDDHLLKTVHNRLGFVLHSRAEVSAGATTALDRAQFESLVRQAVQSLRDRDVEETVRTVMEATVNRLVLLSTPEKGDELRFDIRSLQEFFAGEFLYESVVSDELQRRLDILGGDPHWREVIHFLVSALIENDRPTELAIVSKFLESLNDDDHSAHLRALNRRMATGALISVRLLNEGVLEQDKRVRQKFRSSMEPIAGLTDSPLLKSAWGVRQPNSRTWLVGFLRDALLQNSEADSVGAAIALGGLDLPNPEEIEDVVTCLQARSIGYLEHAIVSWDELFRDPNYQVPAWIPQLLTRLLMRRGWSKLGSTTITAALRILARPSLEDLRKATNLSAREADLFVTLFSGQRSERAGKVDVSYGLLRGEHYRNDWATLKRKTIRRTIVRRQRNRSTSGLLAIAEALLEFAGSPTFEHWKSLLGEIEREGSDAIEALPGHLSALLPWTNEDGSDTPDQVSFWGSLAREKFVRLMQGARVDGRRAQRRVFSWILEPDASNGEDGFLLLIEDQPKLAAAIWQEGFWWPQERPKFLDSPKTIDALMRRIIETPALLAAVPHLWGHLIEAAPHQSRRLRLAIAAISDREPTFQGFTHSVHPISLTLPNEAHALPWLCAALASLSLIGVRRTQREPAEETSKVAQACSLNQGALIRIADDQSIHHKRRVAAVLLLALGAPDAGTGQAAWSNYESLLTSERLEWWFYPLFADCLIARRFGSEQRLRELVGRVLIHARDDFRARSRLDRILSSWRERSIAPLNSTKVIDAWLAG